MSSVDTQTGMGAIPREQGVDFRVWAPHADSVAVIGTFNDWTPDEMEATENGQWFLHLPEAGVGDEYLYLVRNDGKEYRRIDPYAREVTNSVGNGMIAELDFDWRDDNFQMHPWNELVIYELHPGTFNTADVDLPALEAVIHRLDQLRDLGVNAIEIMPVTEFAGDISWGYNPAQPFAVESSYGGPLALKRLVKEAHARGIAVILDVVYNHFGPSDLSMWQFDGWSENGKGGIYFFNDDRSSTPWGDTRPDYGREEVRRYIHDNAMMWIEEYHMDGLRMDMTLFIRSVDFMNASPIPEGWSLIRWINEEIHKRFPGKITIAEDLQNMPELTREGEAGAGFSAQWDAGFVHPVRKVLKELRDEDRSMQKICDALLHKYNLDVFERVVYTESHDEVANGSARVPSEINPDQPDDWSAQKRSTLGMGIMMTAPGIPMLFQGQEVLESGWFQDTKPINWDEQFQKHQGIWTLCRDLISLRLNCHNHTRGLTGQGIHILQMDELAKLVAWHRWKEHGPGDDVVVVANFSHQELTDFEISFPHQGTWMLRFNSDWAGYSDTFGNMESFPTDVIEKDGQCRGQITVGPYSLLIFSQ